MKKNYILDTNVFIRDPNCVYRFEDNDLYVSPTTLKEITHLKNKDGEVGYSARQAKQLLDELRSSGDNLKDGLPLGEGKGKLYVVAGIDYSDFTEGMTKTENDDRILAGAAYLTKQSKEQGLECVLVTDDVDMAFLADIIGVKTEHYKNQRVADEKELYTGRGELYVPSEVISAWYSENKPYKVPDGTGLKVNEFVVLRNVDNPSNTAIGKYDGRAVVPLNNIMENEHPYDVTFRNNGQRFLADAILEDVENIPLVIAMGPAGTAKTFITLACALEQVVNQRKYKRVLITRANVKMDNDYGFLPGTEQEKISPMLRPFYDNLEALSSSDDSDGDTWQAPGYSPVEELFNFGYVKAESLEYMRGRSITDTIIIIDEAQNCTPGQILSIVSRVGIGSKIILLGDPEQIDNKFLSKRSNGIVFAADRFIDSPLAAQVTLKESECVRSRLAKEASQLLKL